jgi:hypothetical protein
MFYVLPAVHYTNSGTVGASGAGGVAASVLFIAVLAAGAFICGRMQWRGCAIGLAAVLLYVAAAGTAGYLGYGAAIRGPMAAFIC